MGTLDAMHSTPAMQLTFSAGQAANLTETRNENDYEAKRDCIVVDSDVRRMCNPQRD